MSSDGCYLDMDLLLLTKTESRQQTSNAVLKLTILGGVDERVDEAVAEHENWCQVVVPASKVRTAVTDAVENNNHELNRKNSRREVVKEWSQIKSILYKSTVIDQFKGLSAAAELLST